MNSARSTLPLVWLLAALPTVLPAQVRWDSALRQEAAWYAGAGAQAVAAHVLLWQHATGGWPKNTDLSLPPTEAQRADRSFAEPTIDNGGTTTPLRFLAAVISARRDPGLENAFLRGFDYLLDSQYASGGWPQFYPLKPGYYSHITYNDHAMVNVLALLQAVAQGREPYAFVDAPHRARAAAAVERGIACILRTQVRQAGRLTAWCAQHDEHTLAPAWARNFEPPSLSGMESAGIVRFLMSVGEPTPEIVAAVEGAVAWFGAVRITGLRVEPFTDAEGRRDRRAVPDPAAPVLWARFYELGTNRPIFVGRDKVIHYDYNAIERERRAGYAYLGDWPADLLERDYPRWRRQHHLP